MSQFSNINYNQALRELNNLYEANTNLKEQAVTYKKKYEERCNQNIKLQQKMCVREEQNQKLKKELQSTKNRNNILQSDLASALNSKEEYQSYWEETDAKQKREIDYAKETIIDKEKEINKLKTLQQENGFTLLLSTYDKKQTQLLQQLENKITVIQTLKDNVNSLQNQLEVEKKERYRIEDYLTQANQEQVKLKEINNQILNRPKTVLKPASKEIEDVLFQFKTQIKNLIQTKKIPQIKSNHQIQYNKLLQEKLQLQFKVNKLSRHLQQQEEKLRNLFQAESTAAAAQNQLKNKIQQCNMLKSKIIVLETKQLRDNFIIEKVQIEQIIENNDPIISIKNNADTMHFNTMKKFIQQLKEKLRKEQQNSTTLTQKYSRLKQKFTKISERFIQTDEKLKLCIGQKEAYERLIQRLQKEYEWAISSHKKQKAHLYSVMVPAYNSKQNQFDLQLQALKLQLATKTQHFQHSEIHIKQQLQMFKQLLQKQKMHNIELKENNLQQNSMIQLLRNKLNEVESQLQPTETYNKYQMLYKEERVKSQSYLQQKHSLCVQVNLLQEQMQKMTFQNTTLQDNYEQQMKKLKQQLKKARQQLDECKIEIQKIKRKEKEEQNTNINNKNNFNNAFNELLEKNYQQSLIRNQQLHLEIQSNKVKLQQMQQQSSQFQETNNKLNKCIAQCNQQKLNFLTLQKKLSLKDIELNQTIKKCQNSNKQMRIAMQKSNQQLQSIEQQFQEKELNYKRLITKLNEDIMGLNAQIREEKRIIKKSMTYEQPMESDDKLRKEFQRNKLQFKEKCAAIEKEGEEKIKKVKESERKLKEKIFKIENENNELFKQISLLKVYLPELQQYIEEVKNKKKQNIWEIRGTQNLEVLYNKIKKICKQNNESEENN